MYMSIQRVKTVRKESVYSNNGIYLGERLVYGFKCVLTDDMFNNHPHLSEYEEDSYSEFGAHSDVAPDLGDK